MLYPQNTDLSPMPRILLMFCCFCLGGVLLAQQSTNEQVLARAELARKEITIGDQLYLEVNVSAPPATEVVGLAPEAIDGLPGIEVVTPGILNTVAQAPELLLQQRFLITSFDTGYIAIPALAYPFRAADGRQDTAYTNDLLLHVRALPVTEDDELRPLKPIIEEPLNFWDFWPLYLAVFLGSLGYAIWYNRKRKTRVAPPPPPPPPPHILAQRALDALEEQALWQRGDLKGYYSELTRILREYLEGRFRLAALEMTTRQITDKLRERSELHEEQRAELGQLLQLSDLVKFAKAEPADKLHAAGMMRVREFVKATGELPSVVAQQEAAAVQNEEE